MKNEKQITLLQTYLHHTMAFVGGMFGAFTFLEFERLVSGQTNNLIELVIFLLGSNFYQMLLSVITIVVYAGAIVLATWIPKHLRLNLQLISIAIDCLAAFVVAFASDAIAPQILLLPIVFAMAFQLASFPNIQGFACSTIFSSNNVRQFISSLTEVYLNKNNSFRPKARVFGCTLLFFHLGVALLTILWTVLSRKSVLFVISVLLIAVPMVQKGSVCPK